MIIMDLETTGLIRAGKTVTPGITQIGAIKYDADFNEIDTYEQDINPELIPADWEEGAIKLRGVGPADLMNEPTFFAAFWAFADFCRGAKVWAGHNINGFDTKVLAYQLERYGFSNHFPWPTHHIDTMQLVIKKFGKRRKLGDVYFEITGKKLEGAHEALADIRATAVLLQDMGARDVKSLLGEEA